MPTARGGRRSRTIRFPPIGSVPSRGGSSTRSRCRTSPARRVGAINYEQPYVRSKTHQPVRHQAHLSGGAERQPVGPLQPPEFHVVRPGNLRRNGVWGGVKDYAGTGSQPTYNWPATTTACGPQRWSRKSASARVTHHNIAITDAHGMNLADEIGIPGANLTRVYQRGSPRSISPAYHAFLLGSQNSLPWDRAERTTDDGDEVRRKSGATTH